MDRRVYSGSCGSFGRAPGVIVLIRVCLVNSGATGGRWVFFMVRHVVVGFIQACPGDSRFHSGLFGSFGCAPGVVWFSLVRFVHSFSPRVFLVSNGCARMNQTNANEPGDHWGAPDCKHE